MKLKKIVLKKITFLFCLIILLLNGCKKNLTNDKKNIILTTTNEEYDSIKKIVEGYNNSQSKYQVLIQKIDNEQLKNYQLRSDVLKTDLITFNNYVVANSYSDKFINLSSENFVVNYQVSIIKSLKTLDGKLNCIPAIGRFYSNCFNLDLFKSNNYTLPKTLDEFMDLIKRMESTLQNTSTFYKSSSSIASKDSILFALMQIAYPLFLSTTEGGKFLNNYYYGKGSLLDNNVITPWKKIFQILYNLYDYNYYSLNDIDSSFQDEVNYFNNKKTFAIQSSYDSNLDSIITSNINYTFYPFVGDGENELWVGSKPLYYLCVLNDIDSNNKEAAIDFLKYFSSNDGQVLAFESVKGNNAISYINESSLQLDDSYTNFASSIVQGKVFIPDVFFSSFSSSVDDIYNYLDNSISLNDLLMKIDSNVKQLNDDKNVLYFVNETFDYSSLVNTNETCIGNYITDSIRKQVQVKACIIPSNLIIGNIYAKGFNIDDVNVILNDATVYNVLMSIKDLKEIIKNHLNQKDYIPLISGITLDYVDSKLKIFDRNNIELNDDENISILIYDYWYDEFFNDIFKKKYDLKDLFVKYIINCKQIIKPSIDGRYGDVLYEKN